MDIFILDFDFKNEQTDQKLEHRLEGIVRYLNNLDNYIADT